jgi:hypothetical protein
MLAIPVKAQILTDKDETAAKNLRVVAYFLTRMGKKVFFIMMEFIFTRV